MHLVFLIAMGIVVGAIVLANLDVILAIVGVILAFGIVGLGIFAILLFFGFLH